MPPCPAPPPGLGDPIWPARPDTAAGASLACFYRARGVPSFHAAGTWWVRPGRFRFYALPWNRTLDVDREELAAALRRARAPMAEYPAEQDGDEEQSVFEMCPAGYDLRALSSSRRREVRRALEVAHVRVLAGDELLASGPRLNVETLARQARTDEEFGTLAGWRRYVEAVRSTPGVVALGAFAGGRLLAWHVTCRDGDSLYLLDGMASDEGLSRHAGAALDYWTIAEAAKDPTIRRVDNGTHRASLEFYKRSVGFELVRRRFATVWHPAIARVVRSAAFGAALRYCSRAMPGSPRVAYLTRATGR